MPDKMTIEVMADGTIKTTTDKVSAPNHSNAESFLLNISRLCGGITTRTRRIGVGAALHEHEHTHDGHTHSH